MGSRKSMSGATWFTENAGKNMQHSSPSLFQGDGNDDNKKVSSNEETTNPSSDDLAAIVNGTETASSEPTSTSAVGSNVKSVREGILERKGDYKNKKQDIKNKRNQAINKTDNEESLIGGVDPKVKEARSTKRREMRDLRNEEIGARKLDRDNKRIDKMAKRNNMSVEDATTAYNDRQEALSGYSKGERPADPNKEQAEKNKLIDDDLAAKALAKSLNPGFVGIEQTLSTNKMA